MSLLDSARARWSASLLVSMLCYSNAHAQGNTFDIDIHTGVGDRQGTLAWNIAGGDNGPNILSELTYDDVTFRQLELSAILHIRAGEFANSDLFITWLDGDAADGSVQDSDYTGDNRTGEYSRSEASAEDSRMDDLTLGAGYTLHLDANTRLRPTVGFTRKQQYMTMSDGVQIVDTRNPSNLGPFRNALKSSYNTEWESFWLGLEWQYTTRYHQFHASIKQYWLDYHAVADWNLRADFAHPKSFEQWATGTGYGLSLQYHYQLSDSLAMWLDWSQESWRTRRGDDRVYLADGSTIDGTLNEATWKASGFTTGIVLRF